MNGYSVPMSWLIIDGRSWVDSDMTLCRAIFRRGLRWTVFTEGDCRYAYKRLSAAMLKVSDVDIACFERRLVALEAHAKWLGVPFEIPSQPLHAAA